MKTQFKHWGDIWNFVASKGKWCVYRRENTRTAEPSGFTVGHWFEHTKGFSAGTAGFTGRAEKNYGRSAFHFLTLESALRKAEELNQEDGVIASDKGCKS